MARVIVMDLSRHNTVLVGHDRWFFADEWLLLVNDGPLAPGYLDAHNGHWVTLTAFQYRVNLWLFGTGSYVPFQVPVVLAHVTAAVLARQVMRRLGVRGWLASGTALAFLLFGSGTDNIHWSLPRSVTGWGAVARGRLQVGPQRRSMRCREPQSAWQLACDVSSDALL
jgi:hypothetical protein